MTDPDEKCKSLENQSESIIPEQYQSLWIEVNGHRNRYWQIPLAAGLVVSGFLTLTFAQISGGSHIARGLITTALILLLVVFYVQIRKERFFEVARVHQLKEIEDRSDIEAEKVPFRTLDVKCREWNDMPSGAATMVSAYSALRWSLLLLIPVSVAAVWAPVIFSSVS